MMEGKSFQPPNNLNKSIFQEVFFPRSFTEMIKTAVRLGALQRRGILRKEGWVSVFLSFLMGCVSQFCDDFMKSSRQQEFRNFLMMVLIEML